MPKIDFKLLVEQLLLENLQTSFFGDFADKESIEKIIVFTDNIHTGGSKYLNKDYLLSYKPYWPYADTLEYIALEINKVSSKPIQFKVRIKQIVDILPTIDSNVTNVGGEILKKISEISKEVFKTSETEIDGENITRKIINLINNRDNYRNYSNVRLSQASSETAVIAAEPYLNQTPETSIINVLKDFGGYDQSTATNIIRYPAEAKFTQRAENIDNMVMTSIIEISKLMLIFYREWIQQHSIEIIDMLNYATKFSDTVSRTIIINSQLLNQALQQSAGKLRSEEGVFSKLLTVIGTQTSPTNPLQKLLHDDYLLFVQGKSLLVLKPEEYKDMIANDNFNPEKILVKNIKDFDGLPEKGHMIYEAYLFLFNNIKKGALPSEWKKIGQILGGLGSLRVGMGPVN